MGELIGKLYETTDYSKFKLLKGVREIQKKRSLEKSIFESGILVPINVNEKFEIIDGQSRLFFAQRFGMPIPYIISNGLGIEDVIELNSTTKPWGMIDYVKNFATEGREEYKKLRNILEEFKRISHSALISVAMGNKGNCGKAQEMTRNGLFSFYNYKEFTHLLASYMNFCQQLNLKGTQQIFFSYIELFIVKGFSDDQLIKGFKKKDKRAVEGVFHRGIVLEYFLQAYNYGLPKNSPKAIKYKIEKNGDPSVIDVQGMLLIKEEKNG
jgi:hypothetical protein